MKKILFLLLGVLGVALPAGAEEHKIEMVTYFPVPYVAYSQIKPTKQLDVGTATACEMNLGCAESGEAGVLPLYVTGNMYLKKGQLDFNSAAAVYSNVVRLGNGTGAANLDFGSNLRVGAINNGYTLDADQTTVDTLDLFPGRINNSFPSCAAVGGTSSISWQELQLKDRKETYLVCGDAKEVTPTCSDRTYKLAHKSECCPTAPYSDTDCWKYVKGKNTYGGQERVNVRGTSTFTIKNPSVGCYMASNVVVPSGRTFSNTVAPVGTSCPSNVGSGVECPTVGYECAYVTDLYQIGSSGVNCRLVGTTCTCTFTYAWGYHCYAPTSSGGYQKNGW